MFVDLLGRYCYTCSANHFYDGLCRGNACSNHGNCVNVRYRHDRAVRSLTQFKTHSSVLTGHMSLPSGLVWCELRNRSLLGSGLWPKRARQVQSWPVLMCCGLQRGQVPIRGSMSNTDTHRKCKTATCFLLLYSQTTGVLVPVTFALFNVFAQNCPRDQLCLNGICTCRAGYTKMSGICVRQSTTTSVLTTTYALGCKDPKACNYQPGVKRAANSMCTYAEVNRNCAGVCIVSQDCTGVCGGHAKYDRCGVCGGDDLSCTGCMDSNACNYDKDAKVPSSCRLPRVNHNCFSVCNVQKDCRGDCGGTGIADSCGVCGGNGLSCITTNSQRTTTSATGDGIWSDIWDSLRGLDTTRSVSQSVNVRVDTRYACCLEYV